MVLAENAVPLDVRGKPIDIETIKELLATDVVLLRDALGAWEAELSAVQRGDRCYPNMVVRRVVDFLERAHDAHWDWYKARLSGSAKRS
ncbi:MAG: hypothetical protein KDE19_02605 [Caldilineaceae bacterium]|nr:hypothetical protein [Caldilineaceae bacterium]